ncbi:MULTISPECIES: carbohydrate ABC transporter permease [Halorubrum]|jgi:glucose/mannose transport system permease protein|uniref:ABC transporter permease n=1 Tax=Halorubrum tropicale TaxID=1765655 RepID=A0A0M9ATW0_9EURY|nr:MULTISPECIES: carbohydrate ABC transporter permease [Halorubrum]KOX97725.1 ABC transporter permease [Halorubrum tropicale]RLM50909.1 carbohydrate ABC transporter permease [Halorubrum sp. Atlit-28R]TKX43526.1 carbohydrate ABC transporter permease [Halorubrum sp. ARQ200]TKX50654.1 carbohydrate ABC transporter permease [Halorubrum sp. ASP121]TKX62153.1 carbohydrate ABC transporter permease [Halorubrum sp. ASP1]
MNDDARTDGGTASATDSGASAGPLAEVDGYRVLLYLGLLGILAFFMIPIESGLVTSFKTSSGVTGSLPFAPPTGSTFTLEKWRTAFDALGRGLINSALYAIPATVISALLGSFAAYGLTQSDWKQRYKAPVLALFVAGIFIPYQAVLVPLSQFWSMIPLQDALGFLWALGINNDYTGIFELIVTHVAYGLPICTVLFRSYYKNMSEEMIEAARLDGASIRRIYRRIVLPLSGPMFAVVLIYQFTQIWNDLLFTLVLVQTESSAAAPIVLILAGLGTSLEGQDFALRMAGAFIAALPTLAVYIAFGEEFAEGVAT